MKPSPKTVVIKKYENRRLYNTTESRYVNLDEVARMVQEGHDIKVLDAATGEDLTRLVLTQIIVEHAKAPESTFPLDVLRQMVVASGKATQENTLKYLRAMVEMYQSAFRAMSPALNPFDFMRPLSGVGKASPEAPPAEEFRHPANVSQGEKPKTREVQDLRQRLEELEGMVSHLKRNKKMRSRRATRARKS
jgi:polyhydroxyalkanoate synthesis repressor PhaR